MLKETRNCSIFNQEKKATYRRWLENPDSPVKGNTLDKLNKDCNNQQSALKEFQLNQGCIYHKAKQSLRDYLERTL